MNFNRDFIHEYRFNKVWDGYPKHIWVVTSAEGAIQLHITELPKTGVGNNCSAGLEVHWRAAPPSLSKRPPSRQNCPILKAPCWHSRSSLSTQENLLLLWLEDKNNHNRVFHRLEDEYIKHFGLEEDSEL